jgi:hypothetical protein
MNVYVSNIRDVVNHAQSKRSNFVYEFKQKKDNVIKRNIGGDYAINPTQQSSTTIVELKTLLLVFTFDSAEAETSLYTIDALSAGVFTSIDDDGSSGTITISKNGAAYAAFSNPLTLVATDTIQVKRTVTTAAGTATLTGTYS